MGSTNLIAQFTNSSVGLLTCNESLHAVGTAPDTLQAVEDVVQTADVLLGAPLDAAPTSSASTSAPPDAGGLMQGCEPSCEMAMHTMHQWLLHIGADTLVTPCSTPTFCAAAGSGDAASSARTKRDRDRICECTHSHTHTCKRCAVPASTMSAMARTMCVASMLVYMVLSHCLLLPTPATPV